MGIAISGMSGLTSSQGPGPSINQMPKLFRRQGPRLFGAGMVDMKPTDPVEGMLMAQLVVANEAALSMYQRTWRLRINYSRSVPDSACR